MWEKEVLYFSLFILCQSRLYHFCLGNLFLLHMEQQQLLLIPLENQGFASYSTWNVAVLINLEFQKYFGQWQGNVRYYSSSDGMDRQWPENSNCLKPLLFVLWKNALQYRCDKDPELWSSRSLNYAESYSTMDLGII